ncbi:MAG: hypothetical protein HQL66_02010 [Magnetococcales bacterium]|nr:hypothetical protein [Magnetococcales bacterium]
MVLVASLMLLVAGQADAKSAPDAKSTSDAVHLCEKDNAEAKVPPAVVTKYCACMRKKQDVYGSSENERRITQWEKTHVDYRVACEKESGWR